ncbi:hypothetical protein H8923_10205 [Romboutsia hominis]|uniref:Spo0E like sporulation regulatory protein n=1 Tax=Romboutsia faecis TaxID=2764597 RepID=A0ABR7JQE3_9FIRM|nr:hypothetical protein [Romboutsia faecis]MBC5997134.1 hypothetical protein [Romboutsia faecis]
MIKIKDSDLIIMKRILGELYLENGNTEEVILLSQAIDKIILSKQKTIFNEIESC